jgi:hypothetical protein
MVDASFFTDLMNKDPDREVLQLLRQNIRFANAAQQQALAEELDNRIASREPWVDPKEPGPRPASAEAPRASAPEAASVAPAPTNSGFFVPDLLKNFFP